MRLVTAQHSDVEDAMTKKRKTVEEAILHEGLMNPLPPADFERLARRLFRTLGLPPDQEDEILKAAVEGRAAALHSYAKKLN